MNANYLILTALLSLILWQPPLNAGTLKQSPADRVRGVLANPPVFSDAPELAAEQLQGATMLGFDPPALSEIFKNAKTNQLTQTWRTQINKIDYHDMPPPQVSFLAGKTLADIAFLVFEDDTVASISLVERVHEAAMALAPPIPIQDELHKLRQRARTDLQGKALATEISRLINEKIPLIARAETEATRDSGVIMQLSIYLRVLYLSAQALAELASPTTAQLNVIHALQDTLHHYQIYLDNTLSHTFKQNAVVEELSAMLHDVLSLLQKNTLNQHDAVLITQRLVLLFNSSEK
jgi:hypothetical protein